MKKLVKIKKRDGSIVKFDRNKIASAILKAGSATRSYAKDEAERISLIVTEIIKKTANGTIPEVEQIQDIVEQCLMAAGHYNAAKAYILYRDERQRIREEKASLGIVDDLDLPINSLKVMISRHLRRDVNDKILETPAQLFERVAHALARVEKNYSATQKQITKYSTDFYDMMSQMFFMPGGRILKSAGVGGPLASCHVLPIEDSIAEIYETVKNTAILSAGAGGVGFNFSHIRPMGDFVHSSSGFSNGPINFMRVIDVSNKIIGMGGHKKAGSIGVLNIDHPDILDFINCKRGGRDLTTFNISVGITNTFMRAVESGDAYSLINPRNGEVVKSLNADSVFDMICALAHENGDPGMLFLDTANKHNALPGLGKLESTNLCGEQWLHSYDVCNLGSINLAKFVKGDAVDYKTLERITVLAVRFMDNGVDLSHFGVDKVTETAKANRRMGIGVMGWADMLVQLKIPYDSTKALKLAEKVMKFINDTAFEASKELAREKGVFANYELSIYKKTGVKIRNVNRTSIAPTGSISMVAECSSGIEPYFALAYRKNVIDAKGVFYVNKYFKQVANEQGFYNDAVMGEVSSSGSAHGVTGVPKKAQEIFVTAHEIAPNIHVKMQAAFQKHVDNSISKTINMPNSATIQDVKDVYMLAWKLGCKGITVYRDGSRDMQILSVGDKDAGEDTQIIQSKVNIVPLSQRQYPNL